jgi:RNA binding exosome subunit
VNLMDSHKPKRSLELSGTTSFEPATEAEKLMLATLQDLLSMSVRRSRLYGMDYYGNKVKTLFSRLNKLK